jgi:predicted DNA-binding helix-hairpin-helix protein
VDSFERLKALTSQMHFEQTEEFGCSPNTSGRFPSGLIHHASTPSGRPIGLLKTLLTTACERNCLYCPFRAGREYRRVTLKPKEMANIFMNIYQKRAVEGLFLSSGVINGEVSTQDKIIETAEILRNNMKYRGYLHLKIMPGANKDQVFRTMQLADRVSSNLEAPNEKRLTHLAPNKAFVTELLEPLKWVEEIRKNFPATYNYKKRWPSSVTQFVVGAAADSDLELLSTSEYLYRSAGLKRTYFSAFSPVENTPFQNLPATSSVRERHLYQASFLIRDYDFSLDDMPFQADGNLPSDIDPKLAWAKANIGGNLIEISKASRKELMRIPGIGPKRAEKILKYRRKGYLYATEDIVKSGIIPIQSAPFLLMHGKQLPNQPQLFQIA